MNTYQIGSWFIQNQNWLIPLGITIIFSIINIVFACINIHHTKKQNEAQQIGLGVTLMQKRLIIYELEQKLLEAIINHRKPSQPLLEETCRADIEIRYLFGSEISEHFRKVIDLTNKACEYKTKTIPDGYGGFFTDHKDFEIEEFSQEAIKLMGESIDLYNRYVDFSSIGLLKQRDRDEKRNQTTN